MSRASLFNYRSGKTPITAKAWQKLERAERAAGVPKSLLEQLQAPDVNVGKLIQATSLDELIELIPQNQRGPLLHQLLEVYIDSCEMRLHGFFLDAEALATLVKSKKRAGHKEIAFFANKIRASFGPCTAASKSLSQLLCQALGLDTKTLSQRVRHRSTKAES